MFIAISAQDRRCSYHPMLLQFHCNHRIVKQLLAYRGSQLSWVDLVGANLLARDIVDGKIHLAPAFFFVDRAIDGSAILLSTLVCCTTT